MNIARPRAVVSLVSVVLVLGVVLAACGGGVASPSASSRIESPVSSPNQSPGQSPGQGITTPQQAAERVGQTDQRFLGVPEQTAAMIGASAWWTWNPIENGGYRITFTVGSGDCQAGCITKHRWIFEVTVAGDVALVDESSDPIDPLPSG